MRSLGDLICDTSVIQYLHQIRLLEILPKLASNMIRAPAVVREISTGRASGFDLPDPHALEWVTLASGPVEAALQSAFELGPGESEVLALGIQTDSMLAIDDALARKAAVALGLNFTGTLGLLVLANQGGIIGPIQPYVDQLQSVGFWMSDQTRKEILKRAEEPG